MKNKYGAEKYVVQENGNYGFDEVDLPFYGDVSLANMTQFKIGVFKCDNGRLFVGIEGHGSYTFDAFSCPSYVAEKLNLKYESDAKSVTDFIQGQFDFHNQHQNNIQTEYL